MANRNTSFIKRGAGEDETGNPASHMNIELYVRYTTTMKLSSSGAELQVQADSAAEQ